MSHYFTNYGHKTTTKNNAPAHSNLSITGVNTVQHTFYAYKYQAAFCQRIYNTNGNFSPLFLSQEHGTSK